MTTLASMRDYIRTYLDLDVDDLPDLLLNKWLDDGSERILDYESNWPWLQHTWSVAISGTATTVDLTALSPHYTDIGSVSIGDGTQLRFREFSAVAPFLFESTPTTATDPTTFTRFNDTLYLLPIPTSNNTLTIAGTREAVREFSAGGAGASPDMPDQFHRLVIVWGLSRAYAHQDDLETSSFHAAEFDRDLRQLHKRTMRALSAPPVVLNGQAVQSRPSLLNIRSGALI